MLSILKTDYPVVKKLGKTNDIKRLKSVTGVLKKNDLILKKSIRIINR